MGAVIVSRPIADVLDTIVLKPMEFRFDLTTSAAGLDTIRLLADGGSISA